MPTPIYLPQQQNQMGNMLQQLVMMKIKQNMEQKVYDKRLEAEKVRLEKIKSTKPDNLPEGQTAYWDDFTQEWGTKKTALQNKKEFYKYQVDNPKGPGVQVNVNNNPNLTKKTQGEIEKKQFDAGNAKARLSSIKSEVGRLGASNIVGFQPKMKAWTSDLREYVFGSKAITTEQREQLNDYTGAAQKTIRNINLYIKEITGAQMSEAEAKRLRLSEPDMGSPNPFSFWNRGDSPTKFWKKVENNLQEIEYSQARYEYVKNIGMRYKSIGELENKIPLRRVPTLINKEARKIETKLRKQHPMLPDEQIQNLTMEQVANMFGLAR